MALVPLTVSPLGCPCAERYCTGYIRYTEIPLKSAWLHEGAQYEDVHLMKVEVFQ